MLECVLMDLNVNENTNTNELIEKHMPFIIKSISDVTGRYVSCENDEEDHEDRQQRIEIPWNRCDESSHVGLKDSVAFK